MSEAYGQVYRTSCPSLVRDENWPHGMAFIGIINLPGGRELWRDGFRHPTPDKALERLREQAEKEGVTDVRPWSGTLPEL